jgi:hypothetical protein
MGVQAFFKASCWLTPTDSRHIFSLRRNQAPFTGWSSPNLFSLALLSVSEIASMHLPLFTCSKGPRGCIVPAFSRDSAEFLYLQLHAYQSGFKLVRNNLLPRKPSDFLLLSGRTLLSLALTSRSPLHQLRHFGLHCFFSYLQISCPPGLDPPQNQQISGMGIHVSY